MMEREMEIQKQFLNNYIEHETPDDQKTLYDRLGNQDPKIREMAYITLSTLYFNSIRGMNDEIFSDSMTKRIVQALSDPIKKNALCVFGIISNILTAADLMNKMEILTKYLQNELIDTIAMNVIQNVSEIDSMGHEMSNSDLERSVWYVEEAFKLLDTIVSLPGI